MALRAVRVSWREGVGKERLPWRLYFHSDGSICSPVVIEWAGKKEKKTCNNFPPTKFKGKTSQTRLLLPCFNENLMLSCRNAFRHKELAAEINHYLRSQRETVRKQPYAPTVSVTDSKTSWLMESLPQPDIVLRFINQEINIWPVCKVFGTQIRGYKVHQGFHYIIKIKRLNVILKLYELNHSSTLWIIHLFLWSSQISVIVVAHVFLDFDWL